MLDIGKMLCTHAISWFLVMSALFSAKGRIEMLKN